MQLYSCWCHPTSRLESLSLPTAPKLHQVTSTIHLKWSVSWCNVPALSGNRSKNPRQKTPRCWLQAIKDRVWFYTIVFHAVAVQLGHGPIPGARVVSWERTLNLKRAFATLPWWKHIGNIVGVLFVEDLSTLQGVCFGWATHQVMACSQGFDLRLDGLWSCSQFFVAISIRNGEFCHAEKGENIQKSP